MPTKRECYLSNFDREVYSHPARLLIDAKNSQVCIRPENNRQVIVAGMVYFINEDVVYFCLHNFE